MNTVFKTLAYGILSLLSGSLAAANAQTPALLDINFEAADAAQGAGIHRMTEGGNNFLRLHDPDSDRSVKTSWQIKIPEGTEAVELTWRQRVTRVIDGERPYFDARIALTFYIAGGKEIWRSRMPESPYTTEPTDGWVEKKTQLLIHEQAEVFEISPTLYTANAATFDVDDLVLKPIDPAALQAEKEQKLQQIKEASVVPDEAPKPENWPPVIHVEGNRLQDAKGNEVWLQGVNAGGLETTSDEQPLRSIVVGIEDWKATCIRLPIKSSFWYGNGKDQTDGGEAYRRSIDKAVTLAANRGAYIALDLHHYRAPKAEDAAFWKDCAAHYKNHPAVLFDIFNEPHGTSWEIWRNGGFVGTKTGVDESSFLSDEEKRKNQGFESVGMQGLVDAVRSTGAENIIIAGGLGWCNDLSGVVNGYALEDNTGNGLMYSWHTYHWHKGWERVLPVAEKYPIFLGEVGADIIHFPFLPKGSEENPYTWVPDMLGFIQKYKINWTGWCLHPIASPILISDWNYTPTPFWGCFAQKALAGEPFELKRMR